MAQRARPHRECVEPACDLSRESRGPATVMCPSQPYRPLAVAPGGEAAIVPAEKASARYPVTESGIASVIFPYPLPDRIALRGSLVRTDLIPVLSPSRARGRT